MWSERPSSKYKIDENKASTKTINPFNIESNTNSQITYSREPSANAIGQGQVAKQGRLSKLRKTNDHDNSSDMMIVENKKAARNDSSTAKSNNQDLIMVASSSTNFGNIKIKKTTEQKPAKKTVIKTR